MKKRPIRHAPPPKTVDLANKVDELISNLDSVVAELAILLKAGPKP